MKIFNKSTVDKVNKKSSDQDFYSETVSASISGPTPFAIIVLWIIAAIIFVLILSSMIISRNTEVIALGKVTPSLEIRTIESLEQGIVETINVRENEHVEKGETLLRLSFNSRQSELAEAIARQYALLARSERMVALLDETDFVVPELLREQAPVAVANETSVFDATLQGFNAQKDVYIARLEQKKSEKESKLAEKTKTTDALNLATEEKNIIEPLVQRRAQPEIKLIQRERDVIIAQSDLNMIEATLPKVDAAIEQSQAELNETVMRQKEEISDELTEVLAELAELDKKIEGYQDTIGRRDILAPVSGIVQKLYVNSIGNIALAGEPLVDLVPDEDSTLITVNINPQDRGQIQECLWTEINITAFDIDKYGTISGWVERISPDSIKDERGRVFFEADIRTNITEIKQPKSDEIHPISVGMEAKVFIKTGERRILGYVLKPLAKNLKGWSNQEEAVASGLFNNDCLKTRNVDPVDPEEENNNS